MAVKQRFAIIKFVPKSLTIFNDQELFKSLLKYFVFVLTMTRLAAAEMNALITIADLLALSNKQYA